MRVIAWIVALAGALVQSTSSYAQGLSMPEIGEEMAHAWNENSCAVVAIGDVFLTDSSTITTVENKTANAKIIFRQVYSGLYQAAQRAGLITIFPIGNSTIGGHDYEKVHIEPTAQSVSYRTKVSGWPGEELRIPNGTIRVKRVYKAEPIACGSQHCVLAIGLLERELSRECADLKKSVGASVSPTQKFRALLIDSGSSGMAIDMTDEDKAFETDTVNAVLHNFQKQH